MEWVLIMTLITPNGSPTVTTIEFETQALCQDAETAHRSSLRAGTGGSVGPFFIAYACTQVKS